MSRAYRHPCGCKSADERWLELCPACKAEHDERHIQASRDQQERERARDPDYQPVERAA